MERNLIAGIAADRNEARITLTGVPDKPGTVAAGDRPARRGRHPGRHDRPRGDARHRLVRPHLHRPARQPRPGDGGDRAAQGARSAIADLIHDDAVAKVSIVGVGIRSNPQLAAKMFETLAERQINLLAVSTSEIKVSALIAEDRARARGARAPHRLRPRRGAGGMSGEGLIAEPRAVHGGAGHARLKELMHRGTEFLGCDVAIMGGAMSWISRAQPRLRHLQRRRLRRDRLRRDEPRAARHRDRRDQGAHRPAVRRQPHHHAPAAERADRRLRQARGQPCRARRRASAGRRDRPDQGAAAPS